MMGKQSALLDGPAPDLILEHPDFTAHISDSRRALVINYPGEKKPRHINITKNGADVIMAGLSGSNKKLWLYYGDAGQDYLCTSCWRSLPGPHVDCVCSQS